eukprot:COSAG04_NODE_29993_length_265_cov_0.831325_1_plen_76_part_01
MRIRDLLSSTLTALLLLASQDAGRAACWLEWRAHGLQTSHLRVLVGGILLPESTGASGQQQQWTHGTNDTVPYQH